MDYSRRAETLKEASKDKLLYHVAVGSNCNKDVSSGLRWPAPDKTRESCEIMPSIQRRQLNVLPTAH